MGWQQKYEAIKQFVITNKEKLDNRNLNEFVAMLAAQFNISPVTIRTQYIKGLEIEGVIEVIPSDPSKPKATIYPKIVKIKV
jgi:hypothetical protein